MPSDPIHHTTPPDAVPLEPATSPVSRLAYAWIIAGMEAAASWLGLVHGTMEAVTDLLAFASAVLGTIGLYYTMRKQRYEWRKKTGRLP